MEKTFVLFKPEIFEKKLFGACICEFEKRGLEIEVFRKIHAEEWQVKAMHDDKPEWLQNYLINHLANEKKIGIAVIVGENAVESTREVVLLIRDLLMSDTIEKANKENRAQRTLLHAPENQKMVKKEKIIFYQINN